jgi:hypothetical protein
MIMMGDNEKVAKNAVEDESTNGSFDLSNRKASLRIVKMFFKPVVITAAQ